VALLEGRRPYRCAIDPESPTGINFAESRRITLLREIRTHL